VGKTEVPRQKEEAPDDRRSSAQRRVVSAAAAPRAFEDNTPEVGIHNPRQIKKPHVAAILEYLSQTSIPEGVAVMMAMMPELDVKSTVANVRGFLKKHQKRVLRAGRSLSLLQSPNMDGMPRMQSAINHADDRLVERASALQEVEETVRAIHALDAKSEFILTKLYLTVPEWNNIEIMQQLGYEESRYRDLKRWAFLMFAEAYQLSDLRRFD
jgi:ArpU family phage transcriptional regulator